MGMEQLNFSSQSAKSTLSLGILHLSPTTKANSCRHGRLVYLHSDLSQMKKFPKVDSVHVFSNKSFLLMDCLDQGTLQDLVPLFHRNGIQMQEPLVLFYTIEMLSIVEALHQAEIIHGDIKPSNLMILYLFDSE